MNTQQIKSWTRTLPAILVMSFSLACGSGGGEATQGETRLDEIREAGVVKIGYANEAPYAWLDTEADRLTGEAPEILREMMSRLGVDKVEGVLTEFGALIPGLQAGRFDIIAAGMYITPERCKQVAFTNPTYRIGEAFIVKKGNPLDLHSYEDVTNHSKATIGVMAGAVEHGYAKKMGIPEDRIVVFPENVSGAEAVSSGRVDCFAGTSLTIQHILAKESIADIEQAVPFSDPVIDGASIQGFGAFVVRPDDVDLLNALNAELATFIGSEEHLALIEPFGFGPLTLPGDVTAADLCGAE